jgi:inorganic pyrophosphatase
MKRDTPFCLWRPHPWHGLDPGRNPPRFVKAYIELTPFDFVKYEIDKITGYLRVDRPQRSSSLPPALYGFIPKTYCGRRVGKLASSPREGDGDPLDICVLSERPINRSEVILEVRVVGGLHMVDRGKADDKILGVLENDNVWGKAEGLGDLPAILVERLRHYFLTYKLVPGEDTAASVEAVYDAPHALQVVEAALQDYQEDYGEAATCSSTGGSPAEGKTSQEGF